MLFWIAFPFLKMLDPAVESKKMCSLHIFLGISADLIFSVSKHFCDKKNFTSSWMRLLAPACQNSFVHYFFLVGPTSLFICSIIYIIGKWSYILLISLSTVQLFLVLNKKQQPTGIQRFSSLFEGPTCSFLAQFSGSFNQKRVSKISRDSLRFAVVFWSLPKLYKQE